MKILCLEWNCYPEKVDNNPGHINIAHNHNIEVTEKF